MDVNMESLNSSTKKTMCLVRIQIFKYFIIKLEVTENFLSWNMVNIYWSDFEVTLGMSNRDYNFMLRKSIVEESVIMATSFYILSTTTTYEISSSWINLIR